MRAFFNTRIFIVLLFVFGAGCSHGVRDAIIFQYTKTVFSRHPEKFSAQFWQWQEPGRSYLNKYKNRDDKQGPAFIGSTTVFVGTTDGVHLLSTIEGLFWFLAVAFSLSSRRRHTGNEKWYEWLWVFPVAYIVFFTIYGSGSQFIRYLIFNL